MCDDEVYIDNINEVEDDISATEVATLLFGDATLGASILRTEECKRRYAEEFWSDPCWMQG